MGDESFEQRINMKRLFKLGRKPTIMCKRFSEGRDEVKFDSRPGCPTISKSDENVGKVRMKLSLTADLETRQHKSRTKMLNSENSGVEWLIFYCRNDCGGTEYQQRDCMIGFDGKFWDEEILWEDDAKGPH
jgi:hypothetical protein